eukprot:9304488-Alexandrium_andersonii.AAC.1
MSASLVGSEMCIRDSKPVGTAADCLQRCECFMLFSRHWPTIWRRLQSQPVSYTHLTLPTICSV